MRAPSLSMRAAVAAALLAAGGLALARCQALLTAPAGSTLRMVATPPFIAAHGGVSVISVVVVEPAGTVVPDGTVVQFFTTLGRIDEQGRTNDGVARVNLLATGLSGTADVTAVSGGAGGRSGPSPSPSGSPSPLPSGRPNQGPIFGAAEGVGQATVQVAIGSARPTQLVLTADPRATIQRPATVRAFVLDADGNPVANVPVFFRVVAPVIAESVDSGGAPMFTDANGIAEDVLRTTAALTAPGRTVVVEATVPGLTPQTIVVRVN